MIDPTSVALIGATVVLTVLAAAHAAHFTCTRKRTRNPNHARRRVRRRGGSPTAWLPTGERGA